MGPEGGDHLGEGTLNCNIIEWGGGPLGPEAMFFKPNGGAEFEIWAWDYHDWDSEHWPMPYATCEGQIWVSSPNCNLKTVGLIGSGAEVCTSAPPKRVRVSSPEWSAVLLQGSGTYAVEAVLQTSSPREGARVLILANGANPRPAGVQESLGRLGW